MFCIILKYFGISKGKDDYSKAVPSVLKKNTLIYYRVKHDGRNMITLDLDLAYLSSYYHIGTNALDQYKNKSITQIMEIEAAKGNSKAAEFLLRAVSDPKELANVFQLINPKNRYLILRNMNKEDLCKVI